ncbi:MAG: type II secretion system protein GspK [Deferribacterota bacterium]|nr:type II secretion system protein GspK [Deferribacterota bacterium]
MTIQAKEKKSKGSVLVYVLIIVSFSVALAFTINENITKNYESTFSIYYNNQAYLYANSAINIVKTLFELDDDAYDSKEDIWYNIPPIKLKEGILRFDIKPINAKININLLNTEGDTEFALHIIDVVDKIFKEENINSLTPGIIKDWIDKDNEPADYGREDYIYDENNLIYKIKNKPLDTIMELAYIGSFNDYEKLKDYFTTVGEDKKLNINFCSEETLKAYIPDLASYASDFIEYRRNNIYKNKSDITKASYISDDEYVEAVNYLTIKSNLYYIKIIVEFFNNNYTYHILYNRKEQNIDKFIEGYNNDYF